MFVPRDYSSAIHLHKPVRQIIHCFLLTLLHWRCLVSVKLLSVHMVKIRSIEQFPAITFHTQSYLLLYSFWSDFLPYYYSLLFLIIIIVPKSKCHASVKLSSRFIWSKCTQLNSSRRISFQHPPPFMPALVLNLSRFVTILLLL